MTTLAVGSQHPRLSRPPPGVTLVVLIAILLVALAFALTIGAAGIPLARLPAALGITEATGPFAVRDHLVVWSIRLPRILTAAAVGGLLAAAGALMQGLFRNPLADPALVGVSSGGAFAAALSIVLIDHALASQLRFLEDTILSIAAFTGSLATTIILYRIATRAGRTSIALFLLAGIAIAAIAGAAIGVLVYAADDRQLRDITFWMMGSLSGANWSKVATTSVMLTVALLLFARIAAPLDLIVLGESEAFHSGVDVERLKRISIVLISAMTGVAVAVCGVVGFVGIVVPHFVRLVIGPSHRLLLPSSVCLGAVMLVVADTIARSIVAPAEMPIGILTAAIGAPFFLMILLRRRKLVGL